MGTNIKFFEKNHINNNTGVTFTSANTSYADRLYDNDLSTKLISISSDDLTPEIFIFTFSALRTIDAVHLVGHNLKNFTVKYWDGAAYADFSTPISESANADTSNFYQNFTQVSTLRIQLTMNTTQTVDAEKSIAQFRTLELIDELSGNPNKITTNFIENSTQIKKSDAGNTYINFGEKFSIKLDFNSIADADYTLMRSIKNNKRSVYVYLGGGADNDEEGFRISDMYLINLVSAIKYKLPNNLFDVGRKITYELKEV